MSSLQIRALAGFLQYAAYDIVNYNYSESDCQALDKNIEYLINYDKIKYVKRNIVLDQFIKYDFPFDSLNKQMKNHFRVGGYSLHKDNETKTLYFTFKGTSDYREQDINLAIGVPLLSKDLFKVNDELQTIIKKTKFNTNNNYDKYKQALESRQYFTNDIIAF